MSTNNDSETPAPEITDPDKYKVIFDNEKVRVLDHTDAPGEKTNLHKHPNFVLYALAPFKRRLHLADGNTLIREFKKGDVLWSEGQIHIGENIGETYTHALIVELKELNRTR